MFIKNISINKKKQIKFLILLKKKKKKKFSKLNKHLKKN
jgi:hypothetical protein